LLQKITLKGNLGATVTIRRQIAEDRDRNMAENLDITLPPDPWTLFKDWYALAEKQEPNDPNAMSLATVGADGMPSVRMVLMKGFEDGHLTFFTNQQSRKGGQLAAHPAAALCFYWKSLRRQIRMEGTAIPVTDPESDAYFMTRPRDSQIGAWASWQSQVLVSRAVLEQRVREREKEYEGKPVPRPPYWGGYRLTPIRMEFWQDQPFRLHDRIEYNRHGVTEPWAIERLYP
jgi:pyridoxamine 5'-phosphate oxidase